MTLHFDLNIFGWILLGLAIGSVLSEPFYWGKERQPYGKMTFFSSLITLILIILALSIIS